jgi:hypothetical protein
MPTKRWLLTIALALAFDPLPPLEAPRAAEVEAPYFPAGRSLLAPRPGARTPKGARYRLQFKASKGLSVANTRGLSRGRQKPPPAGTTRSLAKPNVGVFIPAALDTSLPRSLERPTLPTPDENPSFFETPYSIACIYGLIAGDAACSPTDATLQGSPLTGGAHVLAIVVPYHVPDTAAHLQAFSDKFKLPQANLEILYGTDDGKAPPAPPSDRTGLFWKLEAYLDTQWAHALAPDAKILLVEAASSETLDLLKAVELATQRVRSAGGGQVSMSWVADVAAVKRDLEDVRGTTLAGFENQVFTQASNVVHVAASGDEPGVYYPASSANVVAVGGTTINRSKSGKFLNETPWECAGSGVRSDLTMPSYQDPSKVQLGPDLKGRAIVDVSAVSDSRRGVFVYAGTTYVTVDGESKRTDREGWIVMGGTSAATPIMAGLINRAGSLRQNASAELSSIYQALGSDAFTDVSVGQCGPLVDEGGINCCLQGSQSEKCCDPNSAESKSGRCNTKRSYKARGGWDLCTGVGTPKGLKGL